MHNSPLFKESKNTSISYECKKIKGFSDGSMSNLLYAKNKTTSFAKI